MKSHWRLVVGLVAVAALIAFWTLSALDMRYTADVECRARGFSMGEVGADGEAVCFRGEVPPEAR